MRFFVAALVLTAPLLAQCNYTLDKTTVSLPYTATPTTTVTVTTDPVCPWLPNVTNGTAFLHLTQASQQVVTGSGSFTFSTDANAFGQIRNGTITVQTVGTLFPFVAITQDAAPCNFNFSPASQNFSVSGGSGAVSVTANCAWAVSNNRQRHRSVYSGRKHLRHLAQRNHRSQRQRSGQAAHQHGHPGWVAGKFLALRQ
jgi:hypothetical protein